MPITLNYDTKHCILRASASGQPDLNEYRKTRKKITEGKEFPSTIPTIWDLRNLDFSYIDSQLGQGVASVRKSFQTRRGAKIAYVVSDSLGFGTMRMLEVFFDVKERNSRVFYDYKEAEAWLISNKK